MTPEEFLRQLKDFNQDGLATLSPGPLRIKVGKSDARAAELLDWIYERHPNVTIAEVLDTLDALRWWVQFWAAVQDDEPADVDR